MVECRSDLCMTYMYMYFVCTCRYTWCAQDVGSADFYISVDSDTDYDVTRVSYMHVCTCTCMGGKIQYMFVYVFVQLCVCVGVVCTCRCVLILFKILFCSHSMQVWQDCVKIHSLLFAFTEKIP